VWLEADVFGGLGISVFKFFFRNNAIYSKSAILLHFEEKISKAIFIIAFDFLFYWCLI